MRSPVLAGLALVVAGAIAAPVTAAESGTRFGASLSPVPLILEHWQPAPMLLVVNTGDIPIRVALTLTGDPGYTIGPAPSGLIAAGDTVTVPVTGTGEGEATVNVRVTNDLPGTDKPAIEINGAIRHATIIESNPWMVPTGLLLAVLAGLLTLYGVRRRMAHR